MTRRNASRVIVGTDPAAFCSRTQPDKRTILSFSPSLNQLPVGISPPTAWYRNSPHRGHSRPGTAQSVSIRFSGNEQISHDVADIAQHLYLGADRPIRFIRQDRNLPPAYRAAVSSGFAVAGPRPPANDKSDGPTGTALRQLQPLLTQSHSDIRLDRLQKLLKFDRGVASRSEGRGDYFLDLVVRSHELCCAKIATVRGPGRTFIHVCFAPKADIRSAYTLWIGY